MSVPLRQVGTWQLLEPLGQGGMGAVYRAQRNVDGVVQQVALKLISTEFRTNPRSELLFRREAGALASLTHRNVVRLIDFGRADEVLFLATELLDGVTLREVSQGGRLPWPMVAFVGAEVARALHAAHALRTPELAQGLIHGDVSPSNVMLSGDGGIKLIDFGLARPEGAERSTSTVEGKLSYLPPEAVSGQPKDVLADVYGLGLTLYVALTGSHPYFGANDAETVQRVLEGRAEPAHLRLPDVPLRLSEVVSRMIARDRGRRPSSCEDIANELERIIEGRWTAADTARLVVGAKAGVLTHATEPLTSTRSLTPRRARSPRARLGGWAVVVVVSLAALGWWWSHRADPVGLEPTTAVQAPLLVPTDASVSLAEAAVASERAERLDAGSKLRGTLVIQDLLGGQLLIDDQPLEAATGRLETMVEAGAQHSIVLVVGGVKRQRTVSVPPGGRVEVSFSPPRKRATPKLVPIDPIE